MKHTTELPTGVYTKLTQVFLEQATKGAILIDNNYGYGTTSRSVAHIDYKMPHTSGYERLLVSSEEISEFNKNSETDPEHVMDKIVKIYKEKFNHVGEHFSDWAESREVMATYYVLGGLLLTENEALNLSQEVAQKREQRSNSRLSYTTDHRTMTVKGLPFKGFKRGENTIETFVTKDWNGDGYSKYFSIRNSVTGKGVRGGRYNDLMQHGTVAGMVR